MAITQNMEKRATTFGIIIIAIFLVLVGRLAYLQIIEGHKNLARAEDNRINYHNIGAPRGKIMTDHGEILVSNKMAYSVTVNVNELKEEAVVNQTVDVLTDVLKLDRLEVLHTLTRAIVDNKIVLKDKVTSEEKAIVTENLERLPGIGIEQVLDKEGKIEKEYIGINIRLINSANILNACKTLSELLPLRYEDLLVKVIAKGAVSRDQSTIRIKRNLTQEQMVILEEIKPDYPTINVEKVSIRDYVYGSLLSHVLGYVSSISLDELQTLKDQGYRGDDNIGKTGLERYYESYLRGQDGREEIEVDSRRRKVRTLGVNAPLPGSNLIVNIDLGLQRKVEEGLDATLAQLKEMAKKDPKMKGGPTGGAVIVMNPQNGKILAMTSRPNFDLNLFAAGIDSETYRKLNSREANNPFLNRAVGEAPPAGSIFKLVSAAAFLEEKVIDEYSTIYDDDGRYTIGEWKFDNWARATQGGYGELNMVQAIAHSNNIFFYEIAHKLYKMGKGGITIPEYAKAFGLGKGTGIDLLEEVKGFVPDNEYKLKRYGQIWLPGESLHLSIGQWDLRTTPIQLINYVSAIANGGKLYRPYLVDRVESYDGLLMQQYEPEVIGKLPVSKKNLDLIRKGMVGVTTYGTARNHFKDFPISIAGKTGTAQNSASAANHGWFAGYAPADKPEIAILIFLQNGVSSSYTLPLVRDIMQYYFIDKNQPVNITPEELADPDLVGYQDDGTGAVLPGTSPLPATPATGTAAGTQGKPVQPGTNGTVVPPVLSKEEEQAQKLREFYKTFTTP